MPCRSTARPLETVGDGGGRTGGRGTPASEGSLAARSRLRCPQLATAPLSTEIVSAACHGRRQDHEPGQTPRSTDQMTYTIAEPCIDVKDRACVCLLYTSDAADDLLCVDLGGRRIIKKKKIINIIL